jgi:two-component system, NarL family, sensor histidine kinase EvgS
VNRQLLAHRLQRLGLDVRVAEGSEEALALWRQGGIDLVITDCWMPGVDGFALARLIRAEEARGREQRTPLIGWTGREPVEDIAPPDRAALDDILVKPLSAEALAAVLQRWLPRHALPPDPAGG